MTGIHDPAAPRRDELRLLLDDLACISGTLSEIMTVWRRVQPSRPELRLGRLVLLQDAAGIRAATTGPGCPEAGDRGLWELLAAAVRRAQARLTVLTSTAVPG